MPRYIDADVYVEEMLKIIDKFTETDKTMEWLDTEQREVSDERAQEGKVGTD